MMRINMNIEPEEILMNFQRIYDFIADEFIVLSALRFAIEKDKVVVFGLIIIAFGKT